MFFFEGETKLVVGGFDYSNWAHIASRMGTFVLMAFLTVLAYSKLRTMHQEKYRKDLVCKWDEVTGGEADVLIHDNEIAYQFRGGKRTYQIRQIKRIVKEKSRIILIVDNRISADGFIVMPISDELVSVLSRIGVTV